ncbi:hypothetical protein Q3A66_10910 [Hymenobacter sp. BT770]|uniref:PID-CTERM protein-sorting domain-containing protein n=1 Tax=Hymenobacter sp. BT770 TaxID=2886942 RepID=UPI001D0FC79C|nr:hypothetical protein [Hymenobacter sp. BT770]MCC3153339.1 hypothetical protein [Hymenobacter sp. BT770]MDO3415579.1 hypothetical protein [Hymenobacter sp. BT770]
MKSFLLTAALFAASYSLALAQPGSGGPTPTTPTAPTAIPLDGGVSLLLAGGVVYGMRRLKERRRK